MKLSGHVLYEHVKVFGDHDSLAQYNMIELWAVFHTIPYHTNIDLSLILFPNMQPSTQAEFDSAHGAGTCQ